MNFTAECPIVECYVRASELFAGGSPAVAYRCWVQQAVSRCGDLLRFNLITEDGACRDDVPLFALVLRANKPLGGEGAGFEVPCPRYADDPQLWSCPSPCVSVEQRQLMVGRTVWARMEGRREECDYVFTCNWHDVGVLNVYGDAGHKCAHVLAVRETGEWIAQPNNRICVIDPATVTTPWMSMPDPPRYQLRTEGPLETSCERHPRRTDHEYHYRVRRVAPQD